MNAHFEKVKVLTSLTYTTHYGILLLPSVDFADAATTAVQIAYGEVVVQLARKEVKLKWTNNYSHSVCLAGTSTVPQVTNKCYFSDETYKYNNNLYQVYNSSIANTDLLKACAGEVDFYSATSLTLNIELNYGSIYVNDISAGTTFTTSQLIKSYIYNSQELGFNTDITDKIKEIKNKTSVEVEPIWIVDLRRKHLQSSTSNLWVKSTNPTFALMKPWWLATTSLSLLVTQTFKIDGVLVPGICPYK